jgi:hypothetical protein
MGPNPEIIDFLLKHPDCTNEELPDYSLEIIPQILAAVENNPEEHGVSDLESFRRICRTVIQKI